MPETAAKEPFIERAKKYIPWAAATFGIPLLTGLITRRFGRPVKIGSREIESAVGEFKSLYNRQQLLARVDEVKKASPEAAKIYTSTLRSLRRKRVPSDSAMERAISAAEAKLGKTIEIKGTPPDQYLFDNLHTPLDRYIAGDLGIMLQVANKEWVKPLQRIRAERWWHPQVALRREMPGMQLYNYTVDLSRKINIFKDQMLRNLDDIAKKYGIDRRTKEEMDQLIYYIENKTKLTPQEAVKFPAWMKFAADEYKKKITDPIWFEAAKRDLKVKYRKDYFTHFIDNDMMQKLSDEEKRLEYLLDDPTLPSQLKSSIETELHSIRRLLKDTELQKAALEVLKSRAYGKKGFFGPLEFSRRTGLPYLKDFRDVSERYIRGAIRKIFLDEYLPEAKRLTSLIKDPILKEIAFDYVMVQKGAFGGWKYPLGIGNAVKNLFGRINFERYPQMKSFYESLDRVTVDKSIAFLTNFQYLTKLGLSYIRWPLVNATQTILTTYPLVGARALMHGYKMNFTKRGWDLARKHGVTSESFAAVRELVGSRAGALTRAISLPSTISESSNRVISFHAGLYRGRQLGLKGDALIRYARNVVDNSQWLYGAPAVPIHAAKPAGRLFYQFKMFTINYIKYLSDLSKVSPEAFSRAIGSLIFLGGTSLLPFYRTIQNIAAEHGILLPDENIFLFVSDAVFGMRPTVNLGASVNPFFIPYHPDDVAGPTLSFAFRMAPAVAYWKPGEFKKEFAGIAPPITAAYKTLEKPEVYTIAKRPRLLGVRHPLEAVQLVRPFESRRAYYMQQIQAAMKGRQYPLARRLINMAKEEGIFISKKDLATIRARITKERLEEEQK
ncbi:MAG: hypothetical protein ACUVWN_04660 [bacterium]